MNFIVFVIFCGIFSLKSSTKAQIVDCFYGVQYFWSEGITFSNTSHYSCTLNNKASNSIQKVTKIEGQHGTGHNDDDVSFLNIQQGNKFGTFSSIFCEKFKKLEVLGTDNVEISSVDVNSLENCRNLKNLNFGGTQIRNFPEKLLVKNSKLTQIWIRDNPLTTMPANFFANQNNVELLSLKGNQIDFLPGNIFYPLVKLQVLYLQYNKLQSINPEWFVNLQNLRWLFLNDNQIFGVPSRSFTSLTNLVQLFLYKNKIKTLDSNSFEGLHNLQILSLFTNEISDLPAGVFAPLKNLKETSLYDNKLTSISSTAFGVHKSLVDIYLGSNKIDKIDEKLVDNTALNFINMVGNVCSQSSLTGTDNIKEGLKKCFDNYKSGVRVLQDSLIEAAACGKVIKGQGNIIGGRRVARGNFPWNAVLVTPFGEFFCGATLVSARKVVTAAHCIQDKHASLPKSAGEIIVQLGVYDLEKSVEVGRIPFAVQKINVHPDWNTLTEAFDADIAVLVLDREVSFNEYIRPICLVNLEVTHITAGVVVGYGRSEGTSRVHENIPKILELPIHTNEHCFLENISLVKISSKRTFCGGTGTGIGVCRGDSGSGLIVTDGNAFYFRGIVSSSIVGGPYGCDVDTYSVFTDVTKYIEWINGLSTDRFE